MKNFNRLFTAAFSFMLFFAVAAPQMQAQWTPCGMPLDFGDYYDDIPTADPTDIAIQPIVRAFPNPNPGTYMTVVVRQLEKPGTLELFDMAGRKYREVAVENTDAGMGEYKLSLAGLSPGTYLVSVNDGTSRVTQKVLIR